MSASMSRSSFGALIGLLAGLVAASPSHSQSASRANFAQAQTAFGMLTTRDHNEIFLELMATGDFNAMASGQFGGRLYDAVASFQSEHGIDPTGIVTPETLATLNTIGGRIFNSWGFEFWTIPSPLPRSQFPVVSGLIGVRPSTGLPSRTAITR